ncbi:hypothetical protein NE237_029475 [Protea cynaroides]|uniref:Uncharacterized protein n=1 Tax=Protea cynaroides TaxID=273540 RepID=A0A9Q0GTZ0_9MAGN|nr:hypothetical protein NE237_029475 [Protea cynaroides]
MIEESRFHNAATRVKLGYHFGKTDPLSHVRLVDHRGNILEGQSVTGWLSVEDPSTAMALTAGGLSPTGIFSAGSSKASVNHQGLRYTHEDGSVAGLTKTMHGFLSKVTLEKKGCRNAIGGLVALLSYGAGRQSAGVSSGMSPTEKTMHGDEVMTGNVLVAKVQRSVAQRREPPRIIGAQDDPTDSSAMLFRVDSYRSGAENALVRVIVVGGFDGPVGLVPGRGDRGSGLSVSTANPVLKHATLHVGVAANKISAEIHAKLSHVGSVTRAGFESVQVSSVINGGLEGHRPALTDCHVGLDTSLVGQSVDLGRYLGFPSLEPSRTIVGNNMDRTLASFGDFIGSGMVTGTLMMETQGRTGDGVRGISVRTVPWSLVESGRCERGLTPSCLRQPLPIAIRTSAIIPCVGDVNQAPLGSAVNEQLAGYRGRLEHWQWHLTGSGDGVIA